MKLNLSSPITYFFNIKNKFNDNNYQIISVPLKLGRIKN